MMDVKRHDTIQVLYDSIPIRLRYFSDFVQGLRLNFFVN